MANRMLTQVKIINLTPETHEKFLELFPTPKNDGYVDVLANLNMIYGEEMEELDREWMTMNVGSNHMEIEYHQGNEFSSEVELVISSNWTVPTEYLQEVARAFGEIDEEVVLYGTYEDEGFEPIGSFVYGYDYEDIEDLDIEVDEQEMMDDPEYNDDIFNQLFEHRDAMYRTYLEVKAELEEEVDE